LGHRLNLFDTIFILRPLILIPVWNFLLIGNFLALQKNLFDGKVLFALLIYTAIMGGVYILNQITDIQTDRLNKKLFIISEGLISPKFAKIEMFILWILALSLSIKLGFVFFIFMIISLILGVAYSLPPIKLKGRPVLDSLVNGVGYGMINFAVGWVLHQPADFFMFLRFLPYFLSICAVFINTTIADIEGDRKAGETTTGVFFGSEYSSIISTIILIGAIGTAIYFKDYIPLIPSVISLPIFIYVVYSLFHKKKFSRRILILSFRLPGFIFTIITGYLYPGYFIFLILLFIAMRIYYKYRFGMTYPTLSGG